MKYLILFFILISISGCGMEGIEVKQTENPEAKVKVLFTVDGCTVYRFLDAGDYIYFTNCNGQTFNKDCYWSGKVYICKEKSVD